MITPNGETAYVTDDGSGTVTVVNTTTNTSGQPAGRTLAEAA